MTKYKQFGDIFDNPKRAEWEPVEDTVQRYLDMDEAYEAYLEDTYGTMEYDSSVIFG